MVIEAIVFGLALYFTAIYFKGAEPQTKGQSNVQTAQLLTSCILWGIWHYLISHN